MCRQGTAVAGSCGQGLGYMSQDRTFHFLQAGPGLGWRWGWAGSFRRGLGCFMQAGPEPISRRRGLGCFMQAGWGWRSRKVWFAVCRTFGACLLWAGWRGGGGARREPPWEHWRRCGSAARWGTVGAALAAPLPCFGGHPATAAPLAPAPSLQDVCFGSVGSVGRAESEDALWGFTVSAACPAPPCWLPPNAHGHLACSRLACMRL